MKVYQVVKSYFDGDHDHGEYQSPLFLNKEDAEQFLSQVWGDNVSQQNKWSSTSFSIEESPVIQELEIQENAVEVKSSAKYLNISYT